MNNPPSSARLLEHFRAPKHRLPLHPLERAVLAAVAIHLCFLPWALGTMHVWSQVTSLVLAAIGLLLALIPRTYSGDLAPPVSGIQFPVVGPASTGHRPPPTAFRLNPLPRLVRFPLFWLGLALLASGIAASSVGTFAGQVVMQVPSEEILGMSRRLREAEGLPGNSGTLVDKQG